MSPPLVRCTPGGTKIIHDLRTDMPAFLGVGLLVRVVHTDAYGIHHPVLHGHHSQGP